MERTHTGPPGTCTCQGRGQGKRQVRPPLHTVYDCCICREEKEESVRTKIRTKKQNKNQNRQQSMSWKLRRCEIYVGPESTCTRGPSTLIREQTALSHTCRAKLHKWTHWVHLCGRVAWRWPLKRCCAGARLRRRGRAATGFKSIPCPPDCW